MAGTRWCLQAALCGLAAVVMACGGGGDTGSGGSGDGDGGEVPESWGELNYDCPETVPPFEGRGAQRGACCYRNEPNSVRRAAFDEAATPGRSEDLSLGYRLNQNTPIRPNATLGVAAIRDQAVGAAEGYRQQLMMRFTFPREDGQDVAGDGQIEVGAGTYNCDGTFSFYGDGAAPIIDGAYYPGSDSADRWHYSKLPAKVDPTKNDASRFEVAFEDRKEVGYSYTSYVETTSNSPEFTFDWEIVTQDFNILEFEWDGDEVDCIGTRDGQDWLPKGRFEVYADVKNNNDPENGISLVQGLNACAMLAFGVSAVAMDPQPNCEETPRCMPGSSDCAWLALPDSLCPEDGGERDIFACHVGDERNVNDDDTQVVNCTQDAPTAHSTESDGQCCDPLGQSDTLPACNAFRIVNEFVAASAVITDELATTELARCPQE